MGILKSLFKPGMECLVQIVLEFLFQAHTWFFPQWVSHPPVYALMQPVQAQGPGVCLSKPTGPLEA